MVVGEYCMYILLATVASETDTFHLRQSLGTQDKGGGVPNWR